MSTQTALGHSFPTPCKRCGGALYRQVDYCPYCGAVHPLETGPHSRTVMPGSRTSAGRLDSDPALPDEADPTALAAHQAQSNRAEVALRAPLMSPDMPIPPFEEPPYSTGGSRVTIRRVLLAIFVLVVIGLAYVAYALFSDSSYSDDSNDQTTPVSNQDARTSTGTIAPFTPTQTQTAHSADASKPAAPGGPANTAATISAAKAVPAAPAVVPAPVVTPPVVVAPVKPVAPQFRDASQALQAAHLAFNANDLSATQAALASAQALQPGNPDAQTMASEVRPLAARRDTALQAAQTCVAQQSWSCARQHANEALAIDTGNETAKAILQRVIRETGWAPLKTDASTGAAAGSKPAAQIAGSPAPQSAQLQTPSPKGVPANGDVTATAPRASTAATTGTDANSADARARTIVDSGWSHAAPNGAKSSTTTSPGQ
ncbi:hypothetical protein ABH945_006514 [Paraburkholderia sp. GAS333]|uniref:hypothetical protein n=1 Tax=Paraburkholderia sp. GAS333 TaxID=3156279 RepID=UPI003D25FF98